MASLSSSHSAASADSAAQAASTVAADTSAARPGANLTALRDHNAAAVLTLVRAAGAGGVSRVELARGSGLTAQAISKIVQRLLEDGLVAESGRGASTGGKPRTLLTLVPDARWALGVQLGRDALTVLRADLAGRVVDSRHLPIDLAGWGPGPVLDLLAEEVGRQLASVAREQVLGVGVASPGPLDQQAGVLHEVTGAPAWNRFPLRDAVADRLGLAAEIEKDSTAGVLSVLGSPNRAFIHLDHGLGAGLVLGGAVQRGARTNAGEFGHQVLDPAGPRCRCGNQGCLEALWQAAATPDQAARLLGEGVANLVRLLDLDEVVLGGREVADAPETYLAAVREVLDARLPDPSWQRVSLTAAPAGRDAVALGAAGLVLARVFG
ncbi:ROK family transcriptional regulator [Streptacidiphilus fuscans]|uniref:ROK family transcriptional regulator n=1 Tax=Streptacidiphilus fuscans TaxID=2789292 RepID=A0A931B554_9ACTN|nr:ROK family transcriptional regulator [Streptacidiphilus fuscans]MBF9070539.1 ROK family transcriptional regulator [Streptacidiphilus fuscans]